MPAVKFNAAIPGFAAAKGPNAKPRLDFGADIDKGIIGKALPIALQDQYRVLVPSVDADGNETAGLSLPEITVPAGTATGWSVRSRRLRRCRRARRTRERFPIVHPLPSCRSRI